MMMAIQHQDDGYIKEDDLTSDDKDNYADDENDVLDYDEVAPNQWQGSW